MPRLTPVETQDAAVAYDRARMALWSRIAADLGLAVDAGLRVWVRRRDSGFRLSAQLAEGAEERALLAEARKQRERAAAGCLGLAAAFARAHRGAGQGLGRGLVLVAPGADAIQSAMEQILVALDRYDPEHRNKAGRTTKASTYAAWYAFKGVQDERWQAAGARLTQSALSHWAAVEDAERELRQRLGREPTWDEIVEQVGRHAAVTARRVACVLRSGGGDGAADGDGLTALEHVDSEPLPDAELERADLRERIDAAAPPGSWRRQVVDALAADGERAAWKAAGSRDAAEEHIARARRALSASLPACLDRIPTASSAPQAMPSPSPTASSASWTAPSRSATPVVRRRGSGRGRPA